MIDEPPVSPVGQPPQGSSASVHGEPPESPARRQDSASSHSASSHSASSHSASSLGSGASDAGSLGSRSLDPAIAARLKRNPDGLIPAIAQQHDTGEVLMLAWMNDEALHRTLTTGRATYWSRSRKEYWVKGETSGHVQRVVSVSLDCDGDTILVAVDQTGPACHTGSRTCFDGRALI